MDIVKILLNATAKVQIDIFVLFHIYLNSEIGYCIFFYFTLTNDT